MTALEDLREQAAKLKGRVRDYQEAAKRAAPQERAALKAKIAAYRAALRDIQVQIDHLDPPEQRKDRRVQTRRLDVGAMSFDFFERSSIVWSDIEGHSWAQVEAGDTVELGTSMEQLQQWMAEGSQRLTRRQRLYLDAYYNDGLSMEMIAEQYGVGASTVSRVIRNGLDRMQAWVDSKRLIEECADGQGGFDWARYLARVPVLTDRQRELMLLVLSQWPKTRRELADKLELDHSTVVRTLQLAGRTIRQLGPSGEPVARPEIRDWGEADKFSLALQTNMPLYFYYRYCFQGERVGGVSRYNYELARRREAGISPEDAARELGLKPKTVRSAYSRIKRLGIAAGDTVKDRLDPETYVKLQRLVTHRGSPREPSGAGRVGRGGAPK